jgi:hypothetical protein
MWNFYTLHDEILLGLAFSLILTVGFLDDQIHCSKFLVQCLRNFIKIHAKYTFTIFYVGLGQSDTSISEKNGQKLHICLKI